MPPHTLKTPSLPLIFGTGLILALTLFSTYQLITDTPNQRRVPSISLTVPSFDS